MSARLPLSLRGVPPAAAGAVALLAAGLCLLPACRRAEPYQASRAAAALDPQIDWTAARLIVVQDAGRYKTLDSFAREAFAAMTRREHLPGLSPLASLFEWLFNRDAYADTPLIRVRETGLRAQLTAHLTEDKRQRILRDGTFTPRELADPAVATVLRNLETQPLTRRAAGRLRTAQVLADQLDRFVAIVPQPGGDRVAPWYTPAEALGSLSDEQLAALGLARAALPDEARHPVPGLTPDQALDVTVAWASLRAAWRSGDAAGVQQYLRRLADTLPTLAGPGVYPDRAQRAAEVRYYALGKFTGGWVLYFLALLASVWALVTRWRIPRGAALVLLLAGLGWHAAGVLLRWNILGRIPVANMFEAVVGAAWMGIAVAVLLELVFGMRVFLVAASATGFLALVMAGFVLPGGELGTIPGILDDVQLRIHTVMIIAAYALIFIAAVIAAIYLVGYAAVRIRHRTLLATVPAPADAGQGAAGGWRASRPLLAGAAPGDERNHADLPRWLHNIDWSHLIILNMVFILLFVGGIVLGAWWADYSWGRPWGWDPKEVFALNTWLIYAILLHVRLVVRDRGLWTAWLSLAGCAMMAFNWFFVNFFINSVHSYA